MSNLLFIGRALAQSPTPPSLDNPSVVEGLDDLLQYIPPFMIVVGGALFVVALIYGGYQYLTASGDKEKEEKAKSTLLWSTIGIVIVALSILFVNWFGDQFGAKIP